MDNSIPKGKEKYGGKVPIVRPWNCALDALSRCGLQSTPYQECCIHHISCFINTNTQIKYRRTSISGTEKRTDYLPA